MFVPQHTSKVMLPMPLAFPRTSVPSSHPDHQQLAKRISCLCLVHKTIWILASMLATRLEMCTCACTCLGICEKFALLIVRVAMHSARKTSELISCYARSFIVGHCFYKLTWGTFGQYSSLCLSLSLDAWSQMVHVSQANGQLAISLLPQRVSLLCAWKPFSQFSVPNRVLSGSPFSFVCLTALWHTNQVPWSTLSSQRVFKHSVDSKNGVKQVLCSNLREWEKKTRYDETTVWLVCQ